MTEPVRVVVVDDHPMFRSGVMQSLSLDDGIEVVGQGASGQEALELARTLAPDVILLDISMPGDGIETAGEITQLSDGPKVIMLTVSEQDDEVIRALEAGAMGYVLKGVGPSELIAAVRSVASGESFVAPNLTLRLLAGVKERSKPRPLSTLSNQEERTLRLVATGLSNREVADRLGIQEKTVKYHMTNIMEKLKVRNRVEAALAARREWSI